MLEEPCNICRPVYRIPEMLEQHEFSVPVGSPR